MTPKLVIFSPCILTYFRKHTLYRKEKETLRLSLSQVCVFCPKRAILQESYYTPFFSSACPLASGARNCPNLQGCQVFMSTARVLPFKRAISPAAPLSLLLPFKRRWTQQAFLPPFHALRLNSQSPSFPPPFAFLGRPALSQCRCYEII